MINPTGPTGASGNLFATIYTAYEELRSQNMPTPANLRSALRSGHCQEALCMIDDIDNDLIGEADDSGQTALHWAALCQDKEVCVQLLKKMPEKDVLLATNKTKQNALHYAVRQSNRMFIEEIKSSPYAKDLSEAKDSKGVTPFYYAIERGDVETSKLLLSMVWTPEAVISRNTELDNQTPLHRASILNRLALVQALLGSEPGKEAGITDIAKVLVGSQDNHGQTPLHWAAGKGFYDICEILYKKMDANQVSLTMNPEKRNQTALHFAVQGDGDNFEKIVRLLLSDQDKADNLVGIKDHWGQTALHWAVGKKSKPANLTVCTLLCEAMERDPDTLLKRTERGCTALHFATQADRADIAKVILDAAKDKKQKLVSIKDNKGFTALDWTLACESVKSSPEKQKEWEELLGVLDKT